MERIDYNLIELEKIKKRLLGVDATPIYLLNTLSIDSDIKNALWSYFIPNDLINKEVDIFKSKLGFIFTTYNANEDNGWINKTNIEFNDNFRQVIYQFILKDNNNDNKPVFTLDNKEFWQIIDCDNKVNPWIFTFKKMIL